LVNLNNTHILNSSEITLTIGQMIFLKRTLNTLSIRIGDFFITWFKIRSYPIDRRKYPSSKHLKKISTSSCREQVGVAQLMIL